MSILEKEDALVSAIHDAIPDATEGNKVVHEYFNHIRAIIGHETRSTVDKIGQMCGEDSSHKASSKNTPKANVAHEMIEVNEMCHKYNVDEVFPGVTLETPASEVREIAWQLLHEINQRPLPVFAGHDERKKKSE